MTVRVRIPSVIRNITGGQETITVPAVSVEDAINAVDALHPGFKARICDGTGKLLRFINVYVAEEDIRFLEGQRTAVKDGDLIDIIPAIAGG